MTLELIKGFSKLTKQQQTLFISTHASHMAAVKNKSSWMPISVKWDKTYLKVTFKNSEWLHYTASREWY